MSINESLEKIKPYYTLILVIVIASVFFGLGRLSRLKMDKEPIKVLYGNEALVLSAVASTTVSKGTTTPKNEPIVTTPLKQDGEVIGSKSGKKYYFPWCGTVKRIKPENQVPFASIADAKAAGFTPGGNCKGLW